MRCDHVKGLLLTDYLDKQLSEKETKEIKKHLSACKECLEYAATVKNAPLDPFRGLKRGKPSEAVWLKIKDAIQEEKQNESEPAVVNLWHRLNEILSVPKPVYATVSFALVLIVVFTVLGRKGLDHQQNAKVSKEEQVNQLEYMTYLVMDNGGFNEDENGDYGEVIEEFFLSKR